MVEIFRLTIALVRIFRLTLRATVDSLKTGTNRQLDVIGQISRRIVVRVNPQIVWGCAVDSWLCRPSGLAVNDYAPLGEKVRFQSVDDAIRLLYLGGYSAKVDLQSAYRSVKLHPSNFDFTGLSWNCSGDDEPTYMFDTPLPFGSSLAPKIFLCLTQAVKCMMAHRGYDIVAYLDDFISMKPPSSDVWQQCTHLCNYCGR